MGLPIPEIDWATDLTWKLLAEAEKSENRKTLLGEKKDENTLKDTKIAVFKCIGSVILADSYALNPDAVGDRVKKWFDYLVNCYKCHARQLRTTGEGVQDDPGYEPDEEHFDHYIPMSGPDDSTPKHIKSIWDEIILKFAYFPELHHMLSTCPNITPIVITTGVGPTGKKTVHYQAPSEDENKGHSASPQVFSATQLQQIRTLQEALNAASGTSPPSPSFLDSFPPSLDFDESQKENFMPPSTPKQVSSNSCPTTSTPPSTCTPKVFDAIEKAKQHISKLPKKRTFKDVLANLQQANLKSINDQAQDEINLKKRQLLLEEFKAGIWEVEEYRMKLQELNNNKAVEVETLSAKRAQYSPDWDEIE
ncbi:hypothetical protein BD769DRAFT_1664084 [Suillus cothurnatus]|nr:hypothetical protein BD769DRAFT_1664084 [Suillus cothurnatus]